MIDLRSDTVTRPTPAMLKFMMKAKVGDDVFEDDFSVNELQRIAAHLFGMEAALFCPSGTMTNQIAIKAHTQPMDELICDEGSHIYRYEAGGISFNSGVSAKLLLGNRGRLNADDIASQIFPDNIHAPKTTLVCLENTTNRGGGACYNFSEIKKIAGLCKRHNLKLHLDGARLFNAIVAQNETPKQYGSVFDSISICLSKSLGAPVGSLLLGNQNFIYQARRIRKVFGGGMRQAGYMAAAGIFALQHHVDRLMEDHQHAKKVAEALGSCKAVKSVMSPETNILIFELRENKTAKNWIKKLEKEQVLFYFISPKSVRFVFHLDISKSQVQKLISLILS